MTEIEHSTILIQDISCPICLESVDSNSTTLSCSHTFHDECISKWLSQHHTCPICRTSVGQEEPIVQEPVPPQQGFQMFELLILCISIACSVSIGIFTKQWWNLSVNIFTTLSIIIVLIRKWFYFKSSQDLFTVCLSFVPTCAFFAAFGHADEKVFLCGMYALQLILLQSISIKQLTTSHLAILFLYAFAATGICIIVMVLTLSGR